MNVKERYESAKEIYAAIGVDTDKAVETLENIAISMHCWQGDDVTGFDQKGPLTGGIQTTGNYPGKARTPEELMADIDKVFSLVPGKHKLNLHAAMLFLKMVNLRTETKSSRSISKNGLILRRKKESALISTPPSSPTAR